MQTGSVIIATPNAKTYSPTQAYSKIGSTSAQQPGMSQWIVSSAAPFTSLFSFFATAPKMTAKTVTGVGATVAPPSSLGGSTKPRPPQKQPGATFWENFWGKVYSIKPISDAADKVIDAGARVTAINKSVVSAAQSTITYGKYVLPLVLVAVILFYVSPYLPRGGNK